MRIRRYKDARFDPSFDRVSGYRTKSMLCMPIKNADGTVLGVISCMNKKSRAALHSANILGNPEATAVPFDADDVSILEAFCAEAAKIMRRVLTDVILDHVDASDRDDINSLIQWCSQPSADAVERRQQLSPIIGKAVSHARTASQPHIHVPAVAPGMHACRSIQFFIVHTVHPAAGPDSRAPPSTRSCSSHGRVGLRLPLNPPRH